jgi:hypothetical protein
MQSFSVSKNSFFGSLNSLKYINVIKINKTSVLFENHYRLIIFTFIEINDFHPQLSFSV